MHNAFSREVLSCNNVTGGYTKAVDLWSVGVVLFVLLSGQLPFHGKSIYDLYRVILSCDFSFEGIAWSYISESGRSNAVGDARPPSD